MSKKTIALCLSLILALTVGLGGTLAYLTDRDTDTNIFTVGNVDIDLSEDFEQGAELVPGNKIEKKPVITNEGDNDAWVWMTVAIPAGMESEAGASKNLLHWNWLGGTDAAYMNGKTQADIDDYIAKGYLPEGTTLEQILAGDHWILDGETPIAQQEVDGVNYNVYLFKYATPLTPGETTLPSFHQVYMDTHVDIDPEGNLNWVEAGVATPLGYNIKTMGNPKIYVAAYGIQADGFTNVEDAYKAYGIQWGENGGVEYNQETSYDVKQGYIPAVEGGVIDNLIITDSSDESVNMRAIYNDSARLQKDLTINNSYLEGTYAMNLYAVEENDVNFVANSTTFAGWTSFTGFDSVTFNGCTFKANSNPGIYNAIKAHDPATLNGCELDGTLLDIQPGTDGSFTLVDCTVKGVLVTDITQLNIDPEVDAAQVTIINE